MHFTPVPGQRASLVKLSRGTVAAIWVTAALLVLAVAGCAPSAQPTATAKPAAPTVAPAAKPTEKAVAPTAAPAAKAAEKPTPAAASPRVPQEIIDAANREGQLRIYWTATGTDQWRQRFQDAFNQYYGVKVTFTDTRGNDWARDTAKVITETAAGQKPAWDVMLTTEAHHSDLFRAGLLGQYNWTEMFGVPEKAVMFKGGAYAFAHQVALPAYNPEIVKGDDVPKKWEDVIDPKWKDKVGVSVATHHWARLSQLWGDEKTTQFIQRLAALNPKLGTPADLNQRLELGEIHIIASQIDNFLRVARQRKAPAVFAEEVQPVLIQSIMVGPLKGSPNTNAALLFAGFLNSKVGQQLWDEFQEQSSIFVEGTPRWKFVQGKQFTVLDEQFMASELEARTAKYGRMLGYR